MPSAQQGMPLWARPRSPPCTPLLPGLGGLTWQAALSGVAMLSLILYYNQASYSQWDAGCESSEEFIDRTTRYLLFFTSDNPSSTSCCLLPVFPHHPAEGDGH